MKMARKRHFGGIAGVPCFCYCIPMKNMDFLEIQSLCGFDMQKAHDMAREYPPVTYPPALIAEIMEDSCVDKVRPEPRPQG
mgnify:CR=1 FL=1